MFWQLFIAFMIGDIFATIGFLISHYFKLKRFFEMPNFDGEEMCLYNEKVHHDYAVHIAPGYDYFLWSNCPIRNRFETPHECKIWNCPAFHIGSDLQCKGLRSSCHKCAKEDCKARNDSLFFANCDYFEQKSK